MLKSALMFVYTSFAFISFVQAGSLEENLAIIESAVLRPLEKNFGVGVFLNSENSSPVVSNDVLSQNPRFKTVLTAVEKDVQEYLSSNLDAGIGTHFSKRVFDIEFLRSPLARFVLVGIVNRMDRSFINPQHCGEIRFIYRLAYNVKVKGQNVASRLPMTMNVVLHAKSPNSQTSCAQLAQNWMQLKQGMTSTEVYQEVLSSVTANQLKQVEINLQLVRSPAAVRPDFGGHAEYLLRVFSFDGVTQTLSEGYLENQLDRQRINQDENLKNKFKAWLRRPGVIKQLDLGTALIPTEFLAKKAVSIAPGGMSRSANRPLYGIVTTNELKDLDYSNLVHVKSALGLYRRLNDMSCVGCHQTRAIGGFHFMGKDPSAKYPGNSVFLPGSAHFFGDLPRRKDILNSLAQEQKPDFSRAFTNRPQESRSQLLSGSGLLNGWGAHCSNSEDPSLKSLTCAPGFKCRVLLKTKVESDSGVCVPDNRQEIGDATETGMVEISGYGRERYKALERDALPQPANIHVDSPQSSSGSSGGFSGGMIRRKTCDNLPPEAVCGALPAAKQGFNLCITKKTFSACIEEFAIGVGLRGCDERNPCRDDYICATSYEANRGACVPPYFLFQFRVDGHPVSKAQ